MIKYGVDNLYLYDFSLEGTELEKVIKEDKIIYEKKFTEKENGIVLVYKKTIDHDGFEKISSSLSFNPNSLLRGNNIANSDAQEIQIAIDILAKKLRRNKIYFNKTGAKVRTAAFNINFEIDFEKYIDTLFLIIFQETKAITFNGSVIKSPYIDMGDKIETIRHPIKNNTKRQFYNKSILEKLGYPWTRYEIEPSSQLFRGRVNKVLDNKSMEAVTLDLFLKNFDSIAKHMILCDLKKYFKKSQVFLENRHKNLLIKELRQFKINSKIKSQRNVYEFLNEKYKIYDREFLKTAYYEFDKHNFKREELKIEAKYSHLDTKNQIGYLMNALRV